MSDVTDDNSKNQQESGEESELESSNETGEKKAQTKPNILRGASYMVLLIEDIGLCLCFFPPVLFNDSNSDSSPDSC